MIRQVRGAVGHAWWVLTLGLGVVTTVLVVEAITHNEDHFQLGLKFSWSPLVKTRAREYRLKDNGGICTGEELVTLIAAPSPS